MWRCASFKDGNIPPLWRWPGRFLDFEAPDYSPEATENFRRLLDDEDYINEIRAYSAFDGGALVGMLATRWGRNHITIFCGRQISQARHREGAVRAGSHG